MRPPLVFVSCRGCSGTPWNVLLSQTATPLDLIEALGLSPGGWRVQVQGRLGALHNDVSILDQIGDRNHLELITDGCRP